MIRRIIGGGKEMDRDEDRKYQMDYEEKQMMKCNHKEMAQIHVHVYNTQVDVADDHQHILLGTSGPADETGRSHVHPICTRTSFTDGHWHWVDIMTDRAIGMPEGTHTHYFAGRTSMDDGHCHTFSDVSNLSEDMFLEEEQEMPAPKPYKCKYKRPEEEEMN